MDYDFEPVFEHLCKDQQQQGGGGGWGCPPPLDMMGRQQLTVAFLREDEDEDEETTMTLLRGAAMCHTDEFDYLKQGAMLSLVLLAGWLG